MDFLEIIKKRRSIRNFAEKNIEKEKIELCLEAAFQAPSPLNSQPWKFYVISGKRRNEILKLIRRYPIYVADLLDYYEELSNKEKMKAIENFAENLGNAPVIIIVTTPKIENDYIRKTQILACGAAIENLMLQASVLGLGTVCVTSVNFIDKDILEYLNAENEELVTLIALGYPQEEPPAKKVEFKAVYLTED